MNPSFKSKFESKSEPKLFNLRTNIFAPVPVARVCYSQYKPTTKTLSQLVAEMEERILASEVENLGLSDSKSFSIGSKSLVESVPKLAFRIDWEAAQKINRKARQQKLYARLKEKQEALIEERRQREERRH